MFLGLPEKKYHSSHRARDLKGLKYEAFPHINQDEDKKSEPIVVAAVTICLRKHNECSASYVDYTGKFRVLCHCVCHKTKNRIGFMPSVSKRVGEKSEPNLIANSQHHFQTQTSIVKPTECSTHD